MGAFRIETSRLNKNRCVKLHFQDKNMVRAVLIIKPFSIYYEQLPLPNIFSILALKTFMGKASVLRVMYCNFAIQPPFIFFP